MSRPENSRLAPPFQSLREGAASGLTCDALLYRQVMNEAWVAGPAMKGKEERVLNQTPSDLFYKPPN